MKCVGLSLVVKCGPGEMVVFSDWEGVKDLNILKCLPPRFCHYTQNSCAMKNFLFSHRISENPQDTHLGEKVSEPRTQFYFYLYRKLCFLLHSFIHTLIFYRKYHVNEKESMIDFSETLTKSYKPVQNIRSLIATPLQVFKTQNKTRVSICPRRRHTCHDSTCPRQHQPLQSFFQNAPSFVDMYKM